MANPFTAQFQIALLFAVGVCSGLAGCKDKDIISYQIPKDPGESRVSAEDAAAPASPGIRWVAPEGWQSQPASSMRQGSFLVAGAGGATADMSVVSFPGDGGDDLANINRWRNQVKLAPISAAELAGQMQSLAAAAGQFVMADLAGAADDKGSARILGAWLRQSNRVWFFKMMGPSDLVEAQKNTFVAFLRSVSLAPEENGGPPLVQANSNSANTNDLPRAELSETPPPIPAVASNAEMDSIPVRAESGSSLVWQAPADWKDQPGNPMRKGSYSVGSGAEVAITAFPGEVGGVLANVNRWRGQAGLDQVDEAGLGRVTTAIDSNGLHFVLVDAEGGSTSIMAALLPWNGGTWFFKLTGPPEAVAGAKPAFQAFLKTVRAP
jgi:hypothetical protein